MTLDWLIVLGLIGATVAFIRYTIGAWERLPRWRRRLYVMLSSIIGASALAWVSFAVTGDRSIATPFGRGVVLSWALVWAFTGLLWLMHAALSLPWTPLAVARSVLNEAMSTRIVPGVIIALFVGIVALPMAVDTERPLLYRIQQHLAFAFLWTTLLLSLMTVFFSCWTLSREVEQKLVFTTLTKPISRGAFLLGKWLGLVLLNALLVGVAGGAVWALTVFHLAKQPPTDAYDAVSIRQRVLTARVSAAPTPTEDILTRVEQQLAAQQDERGADFIASRGGIEAARAEILRQVLSNWRSLAPAGHSGAAQTYLFDNLQPVRAFAKKNFDERVAERLAELREQFPAEDEARLRNRAEYETDRAGYPGQYMQIQYKLRANQGVPENKVRLGFAVNQRMITQRQGEEAPLGIRQTRQVPSYLIDDETGQLELTVVNLQPDTSMYFVGDDGLMLLHKAGTFGPNLLRAWLIVWIKLAFLSALGLALSSFLGFPVAVLATLLVLGAANSAQFIMEATRYYGGAHLGAAELTHHIPRMIARGFTWPVQMYAKFKPGNDVVDGLFISWQRVGQCALWIGGVWTAVVGLYGWWRFGRRELARVQV